MTMTMAMVAISMHRDARSRQTATAIAWLIEHYPRAFFMNHADRCPLKIGIAADLLALVPFAEEELGVVLRHYTASDGYLQASIEGAPRRDLDGNAVGVVDAHQAKHALKVLAEREAWRAKKKSRPRSSRCTRAAEAGAASHGRCTAPRAESKAASREANRGRFGSGHRCCDRNCSGNCCRAEASRSHVSAEAG
jgi:ProP effector